MLMADDIDDLTADQARAQLVRDGANMQPAVKERLTRIASGMDPPQTRQPAVMSPFGTGHLLAALTPAQLLELDPDGEMVSMVFPRAIKLQLQGGRMVQFGAGTNPVPKVLENHPYFVAHGVKRSPPLTPPPRRAKARTDDAA